MLEIQKEGDRIAVLVDGRVVWLGTMSEWSKAVSHPTFGRLRAA